MLWRGSSQCLCGARGIPWFVPLATGWILVVKHSMVLEAERPQEIAKEAETELEDAERLEVEQK